MGTADILDAMCDRVLHIPNERFDMRHWWCGSVGCVIGHCWDLIPGLELCTMDRLDRKYPVYEGLMDIGAVSAALQITHEETLWLFHSSYYAPTTKYHVIQRIRHFAKDLRQKEMAQ